MKYVRILCAVALVFALCSAFTMAEFNLQMQQNSD